MDLLGHIPGVAPLGAVNPGATTPAPYNVAHTGAVDGTGPGSATKNMAEIYNRDLLWRRALIATAGLAFDPTNWVQEVQAVVNIAASAAAGVSTPDATDVVKGKVALAVAANYPSASDTEAVTPAYLAASVAAHSGYLYVRDEKAVAVDGGASVVGVQTRVLNTVVNNTIAGAALAANQITLPAGTYRILASAPSNTIDGNVAVLRNVTDAVNTLRGNTSNGLSNVNVASEVKGQFTIAAPKVFELQHYCVAAVAVLGLGQAANVGVFSEVYSEVEIFKVS